MDGKTALNLSDVLASLSLLLAASATVERVLEFLDRAIESVAAASERLTARALERRASFRPKGGSPQGTTQPSPTRAPASDTAADGTTDDPEGVPFTLILVEEGKPKERRVIVKRFIVQGLGCVLGTVLCFTGQLGIFKMLGSGFPAWLDFILTGILIGAGTEPIHNLIRFLQEKRQTAMAEEEKPRVQARPEAPAVVIPKPPVIGIDYDGGWMPEKYEDRKRQHDPDMIIYHHTATHSDATFVDIVKIIEARGFATGYHCVITADGQYVHYCRWDARGIHTKGYNERSLGVAFVGSFETDPTVPNGNPDGRLGNQAPTDAQLTTGARLVALWMLLYGIQDLNRRVLPHKAVAAKACPGNNFPYQRFLNLVKSFHAEWSKSPQAMSELRDLSQKKYVYVEAKPRRFTVSGRVGQA